MRLGDFRAAFRHSDAVLRGRDPAGRDDPALPYHLRWVWDGRPFRGRDVVVRCYHGLGDTLQFSRFLPALGRVAGRVTVEVQAELAELLRPVEGVDRWHPFDPANPLPPGECDLEIMELAHALRQEPDPAPYLRAPPLAEAAGYVGFCWAGGDWDRERSLPAEALRPVLDLPGLRAVSLQRGMAAGLLPLPDPLGGSMDVARLAGLLAGLRAVVTVDTMVAHLAGALGCPVFLLLKHDPDWRWGAEGAWYRGVRSFRQERPGEWGGAVRRLAGTLAAVEGL